MQRTTFKQKILLVIFGILLFLILLELGLRLGGFILLSIQEYRNRLAIQQKGSFRIICLGESTTAPYGIKDYSYPGQLQGILNQKDIGVSFSVINKGLPATNTSVIVAHLGDNLNKYRPDMVVTMMGINDGEAEVLFEEISERISPNFFGSFRVYKLINLLRLHIREKIKQADIDEPKSALVQSPGYEKEVENCKLALSINPEDYDVYLRLGWLFINSARYKEAEEIFNRAIDIDPLRYEAYIGLGNSVANNNQDGRAEALRLFKKAINIAPGQPATHYELGMFYFYERNYAQAAKILEKVIKMDLVSLFNSAHINLGLCYLKEGRFQEAERMFIKLIELYPKEWMAYRALSQLYIKQGKLQQADKVLEKINALSLNYYNTKLRSSYIKLKEILDQRGIQLVCVQYPMRSIEPLKKLFPDKAGIIFVDNEKTFKDAVRREGYDEYFNDIFAGDFGHCTSRGNRLLAENIAKTILKEYFKID